MPPEPGLPTASPADVVREDGSVRTVAEHQTAVRSLLAPLGQRQAEPWRPGDAVDGDRVLAADLINPIDLPPFDNSQMDGYAVRSDSAGGVLRVAPRIVAGGEPAPLDADTAAPIMTGAPMPAGADAVVPIEDAIPPLFLPDDGEQSVSFETTPSPGAYVRARGSDLKQGELLLAAGTRLGAAQWGVIAASGLTAIALVPRVRVLLLSTGNELVAAGQEPRPGQIYDANGTSLTVAVAASGAVVVDAVVVPDSEDAVAARLREHDGDFDLVLTTGGVSQGTREVVRDVFEGAGVEFVSVGMQPGGPQGLGIARLGAAKVPLVAFPGNPVSALVSFEMFLRPVLRMLHGLPPHRATLTAPLAAALDSPANKHQVRRGRLTEAGEVELVGGSSSHLLHSYAASTVLAHVPVGVSHLDAGDSIEVWRIDD
jgi:molybdopterin molybdotransferase